MQSPPSSHTGTTKVERIILFAFVGALLCLAGWVAHLIAEGTASTALVGTVAAMCAVAAGLIGGGAQVIQGWFTRPIERVEVLSTGASTMNMDHTSHDADLPPELAAWVRQSRQHHQERSLLSRDITDVTQGRPSWAAVVVNLVAKDEASQRFVDHASVHPDRDWPLTVLAHYTLPDGGIVLILPSRDLQFGTRWLIGHLDKRLEGIAHSQVGVAVCPQDGRDPEVLVRFARDAAATSDGTIQFHDVATAKIAHLAEELAMDARRALRDHELIAHYQPIVSTAVGQIAGVEGFVRWVHPERGILPARLFMPGVDRSGVSLDMGAHILSDAVTRTARWRAREAPSLFCSINVSEAQLRDTRFHELLAGQLASVDLDPRALVLECAPLDLLRGWTEEPAALNRLMELGVTLWADVHDESLHDVRALGAVGVSGVKLPVKRFVGPTGLLQQQVIDAWIGMTGDLRWRLSVKNVETRRQLDTLWGIPQVDFVQGRAICGPVPPNQIRDALRWEDVQQDASKRALHELAGR